METREILEKLCAGTISMDEAEHHFKQQPFEEMGDFAKLDMHRKVRSGFPEVVFCAGKADDHLRAIYERLYAADGEVFGTRASEAQYELIRAVLPQVEYDPVSHILKIEKKRKSMLVPLLSARREPQISRWQKKRRRRVNISDLMWSGSMMWGWQASIACLPRWIRSARQTASLQWPGWRAHWRA